MEPCEGRVKFDVQPWSGGLLTGQVCVLLLYFRKFNLGNGNNGNYEWTNTYFCYMQWVKIAETMEKS